MFLGHFVCMCMQVWERLCLRGLHARWTRWGGTSIPPSGYSRESGERWCVAVGERERERKRERERIVALGEEDESVALGRSSEG